MFKNFSYVFGLGALFMLAACDSGDKKSTDGKESVAKSQKTVMETRKVQQIKKVSEKEQKNNKGTAEENQDEENWGIYADINHPIEDETPTSSKNNNTNVSKNTETEAENLKVSETEMVSATDGMMPQKDGKKEYENSEPVKEAVVDSTKKSDSETKEEISTTENIPDNINHADSVNIANNEQYDAKETHIDDTNEGNNEGNTEPEENSSETPEVSMVSDVPVISEESIETQPVETELIEIDQISEPIPNEMEKNSEAGSVKG